MRNCPILTIAPRGGLCRFAVGVIRVDETGEAMSILGVLILLLLFAVFYLWPACARPGGGRRLAFICAGVGLALFWGSAFWGPIAMEAPRGLGAAIDLFLRIIATGYVLTAAAAQAVRGWAEAQGIAGYRHWIVVALGVVVPPLFVMPFA